MSPSHAYAQHGLSPPFHHLPGNLNNHSFPTYTFAHVAHYVRNCRPRNVPSPRCGVIPRRSQILSPCISLLSCWDLPGMRLSAAEERPPQLLQILSVKHSLHGARNILGAISSGEAGLFFCCSFTSSALSALISSCAFLSEDPVAVLAAAFLSPTSPAAAFALPVVGFELLELAAGAVTRIKYQCIEGPKKDDDIRGACEGAVVRASGTAEGFRRDCRDCACKAIFGRINEA